MGYYISKMSNDIILIIINLMKGVSDMTAVPAGIWYGGDQWTSFGHFNSTGARFSKNLKIFLSFS